tara:strand:- start:62 stop:355 length:294 start_codon:yes stop_codon:yes gene_type:complete
LHGGLNAPHFLKGILTMNTNKIEDFLGKPWGGCLKDHTYLNTVGNLSFYEHGTFGDDEEVLVSFANNLYSCGYAEVPDIDESEELFAKLIKLSKKGV